MSCGDESLTGILELVGELKDGAMYGSLDIGGGRSVSCVFTDSPADVREGAKRAKRKRVCLTGTVGHDGEEPSTIVVGRLDVLEDEETGDIA